AILRFVGLLGLVFTLVYVPLWAMRVGLLTRFWATFGMASGASLVLVPFGVLLVAFWFAVFGLELIGKWVRPLPPAWAAGVAVPLPGRDQISPQAERTPSQGGSGTVEGSGREVSESTVPEADEPSPESPYGETQGQRRKKRKRRT